MKFISFYDKIKHFFKNITNSIITAFKDNKIELITLLFLIAGNLTAHSIGGTIRYNKTVNNQINHFMKENNEDEYNQATGISYETKDGIIDTHRVLSDQSAYRFYIKNKDVDNMYIYDENNNIWKNDKLEVFPSVAEAFIFNDIGLVDSLKDDVAIIDSKEYEVTYRLDKVEIKDFPIYTSLPPLPGRTIDFVEDYMDGVRINELEYIDRQQKDGYEEIYFQYKDKTFRILSYVNGRVNIARVRKLK